MDSLSARPVGLGLELLAPVFQQMRSTTEDRLSAGGMLNSNTIYVAFAIAVGASAVVAADGLFVRSMQTHPDATLSAMILPLDAWARSQGAGLR
jgi:hypothetical protein